MLSQAVVVVVVVVLGKESSCFSLANLPSKGEVISVVRTIIWITLLLHHQCSCAGCVQSNVTGPGFCAKITFNLKTLLW